VENDPGLDPRRIVIVGILNVTPDSFSDGGAWPTLDAQIAAGERLAAEGADFVEIGGESTRPGSDPVSLEVEVRRVIPVVRELRRRTAIRLAVDTSKAEVARQAVAEGATLVNDVTALRGDPRMADTVRDGGAAVVLMHMQGTPRTMQEAPRYQDVVAEVAAFLAERIRWAESRGIGRDRMIVDPGIGFGKRVSDNLRLIAGLDRLRALGCPLMIGASRKSFIGKVTGRPVAERVAGTCVAHVFALLGGATHVRAHDVAAARDVVRLVAAIREPSTADDEADAHGRTL
jgi:dihydropteroate synthase